MTDVAAVRQRLRERADSYSRDALVLRADGDPMASYMQAVADELRKVADEVTQ